MADGTGLLASAILFIGVPAFLCGLWWDGRLVWRVILIIGGAAGIVSGTFGAVVWLVIRTMESKA